MRIRWSNILLAFLVIWILILIYLLFPSTYWQSTSHKEAEEILSQVSEARQEIERLTQENAELRKLLKDSSQTADLKFPVLSGPSKDYEQTRRQIARDTNEFWWYIRSRLEHLGKNNAEQSAFINATLKESELHHNSILLDLDFLSTLDGHADWRLQEAKDLEDLVQKRLSALQNPPDCNKAKKLLCNLNKGCGYGCQLHHAVYCFIVAYGTERTLILKSKGWRYNRNGFEEIFQPLSDTCVEHSGQSKVHWPGDKNAPLVEIPIIDSINPRPKFLPPAIPKDLAERILRIHGDPIVWWVSQFLKYLLRPQKDTAEWLEEAEKLQKFAKPIVGIHVRRTDKVGTEAAFHSVEEYMKYVEEYYKKLEMKQSVDAKRVYVATDDPKVLAECRKKFPDFVFLGDAKASKSAAVSTRYSSNSLKGVITDIHMLSRTDYLVCTFSSQVCRVAYEIMQYLRPDASDSFKSLDDIWYFGGQDEHQQVAVMEHHPGNRDEIELKIGDIVGVAGNHWNGFNKGRNHRTSRIGLYPQFKAREKVKLVDFPTYSHVQL